MLIVQANFDRDFFGIFSLKILGLATIFAFSPINHADNQGDSIRDSKQKLEEITANIERLKENIENESREYDRLLGEMERLDKEMGDLHKNIQQLQQDLNDANKQHAQLLTQEAKLKEDLVQQDINLKRQIRLAYLSQSKSKLQALIASEQQMGATAIMYEYINQARLDEIDTLLKTGQAMHANRVALQQQQQQIETRVARQNEQLALLNTARSQKDSAQRVLQDSMQSAKSSLKQAQERKSKVQKLIKKLQRAATKHAASGFDRAKGQMFWPVSGKLLNKFGARKHGSADIAWDGIVTAASRGSEVKSIYPGTVIFSDYFQGYGWLMIIDHGQEYMSLYAHAEVLMKAVGEQVEQGETIALVGDSGHAKQPELYFEIRRQGTPLNPQNWCKLPNITYSS